MGDHGAGHLSPLFSRRLISRNRRGNFDLNLSDDDRTVLGQLAPQMIELLRDPGDPVLHRLFPPAYSDPAHLEHQEEYRRLMQEDLVERQRQQLEMLSSTAEATSLTEEQLMAWTLAINSVRLVLGTSLNVSEEDDNRSPETPQEALYWWLGVLLSEAIDALSGQN